MLDQGGEEFTYLDLLSTVTCAVFLTIGSGSDLKSREVSNKLWVVFLPMSVALTIIRLRVSPSLLPLYATSIALSTAIAFLVFHIGFFGGADAKALITLAVAQPLSPDVLNPMLGYLHPFFPITVFMNSLFVAGLTVAYVATRNLVWKLHTRHPLFSGFEHEPILKRLLAFCSGYKIQLSELRIKKHLIPIEDVETDGEKPTRKLRVFARVEEDFEALIDRFERNALKRTIPSEVWVTPGLPMLVFIALGFIVTLVLGDILFFILRTVSPAWIGCPV